MAPRDLNDDEDWEQVERNTQADDEFDIIEPDRTDRSGNLDNAEPATPKDYAAGSDASTSKRPSSRSTSPSSPQDAPGDNMALVKREPSNSQLTLAHRSRTSPQQQQQLTTTQTRATPATPATPATAPTRPTVNYRTWTPQQQQGQRPNNSGHTYGTIYARGNATVLMGNVGPASGNARNHSYGPVFTTDQARIYVGDITSEEAARIFQNRRNEGNDR